MSFDELMSLFFGDVATDDEFLFTAAAKIAERHPLQLQALLPALSNKRLRAAIFALGDAQANSATLQTFLTHDDPIIVMETIDALSRTSSTEWRRIEPFLRHGSEYVRGAALRFCGKRLGVKGVGILLEGLKDPHPIVKQSAIDELDERALVNEEVASAIRPFVNEVDADVRQAARWALSLSTIYKILPAPLWRAAQEAGAFRGTGVDLADGYIHFSTAAQVAETARRHFAGQRDLLLVAVDSTALGDTLRWEPSRGGDLFPHLYGALPLDAARRIDPLPIGSEGAHDFSGLLT